MSLIQKLIQPVRPLLHRAKLLCKLLALGKRNPELAKLFLICSDRSESDTQTTLQSLAQQQHSMLEFQKEFEEYSQRLVNAGFEPLQTGEAYPCLHDRTSETAYDRHYIYHPAWAARILARTRPDKHIDISSTLHFCTLISAFINVEFYDYRPAPITLSGLKSAPADLTQLPFESDSIQSLSCMHVIEHIGLGRYGDPYDVDGDQKAAHELTRVLAPGGQLIVAFPVGRPRIQFNAHRIYSHEQVLTMFAGLTLKEHCLIPDGNVEHGPIENPTRELIAAQSYGCGCYVFTK